MDKVQIIVTGATGSMGSKAVCALGKGEAVRKRIQKEVPSAALQLMQVDMASLASVVSFVENSNGDKCR